MFERFTDEARRAVVVAQEEGRGLRAEQIEPVHLLLALTRDPGTGGQVLRESGLTHTAVRDAVLRSGGPLDADALATLGIDLDSVRAATEAAFGPGALDAPGPAGHMPFTRGSKQALEQALRFAVRRKERRIEARHLLFGVLAVADPTVVRVVQQLGTDSGALRGRLDGSDAA
ncbi:MULTISPECIES: Clp protease N-terminal domain-containing protein [unclassified Modestobacter]